MRITVSECAGASYSNCLSTWMPDVTGATREGASKPFTAAASPASTVLSAWREILFAPHIRSQDSLINIYQLSYRDLEEMMSARGLFLDHTTVWGWGRRYGPEINNRPVTEALAEIFVYFPPDWVYKTGH